MAASSSEVLAAGTGSERLRPAASKGPNDWYVGGHDHDVSDRALPS